MPPTGWNGLCDCNKRTAEDRSWSEHAITLTKNINNDNFHQNNLNFDSNSIQCCITHNEPKLLLSAHIPYTPHLCALDFFNIHIALITLILFSFLIIMIIVIFETTYFSWTRKTSSTNLKWQNFATQYKKNSTYFETWRSRNTIKFGVFVAVFSFCSSVVHLRNWCNFFLSSHKIYVPTTFNEMNIDVGGCTDTWHSYRPASLNCTYFICNVQSWNEHKNIEKLIN